MNGFAELGGGSGNVILTNAACAAIGGVVLAAIQGLDRKLEEQLAARDAELAALRKEMEASRALAK